MLTLEEVKDAAPNGLRGNMTQAVVDQVNQASTDPEHAEAIRNNFISYITVMRDGKFKAEDYVNAVTYVSYKLMGYSNKEAYERTFPLRYTGLVAQGKSKKDIASYVAGYNKGRLVTLISEQTAIPAWVLNQDIYQQAINTQADLMINARSEKVRADAANSILTHLKKPETKQVDLNIGVQETSGMTELRDLLTGLAEKQQAAIEQGVPTKEIAHQSLNQIPAEDLIDITAEEVPIESDS